MTAKRIETTTCNPLTCCIQVSSIRTPQILHKILFAHSRNTRRTKTRLMEKERRATCRKGLGGWNCSAVEKRAVYTFEQLSKNESNFRRNGTKQPTAPHKWFRWVDIEWVRRRRRNGCSKMVSGVRDAAKNRGGPRKGHYLHANSNCDLWTTFLSWLSFSKRASNNPRYIYVYRPV